MQGSIREDVCDRFCLNARACRFGFAGRAQTATYTIPVILSQTGAAAAPGQDQLAALQAYEKLVNRRAAFAASNCIFRFTTMRRARKPRCN